MSGRRAPQRCMLYEMPDGRRVVRFFWDLLMPGGTPPHGAWDIDLDAAGHLQTLRVEVHEIGWEHEARKYVFRQERHAEVLVHIDEDPDWNVILTRFRDAEFVYAMTGRSC